MRLLFILLFLLPQLLFAQKKVISDTVILGCGISRPPVSSSVVIDSFLVLDEVDIQPVLQTNLDSNGIKDYPAMELYNEIKGNVYGYFRVDTVGNVDSAWISSKITPGIDKQVLRVLKYKLNFIPAQNNKEKVPCICRLSFHYIIKE